MFFSVKRPQWQRIYRQTITLIYKNLLIFYTAPFSALCRALLFPVAVAIIFSFLKHINTSGSSYSDTSNYGIANSSTPVKGIGEAIAASSSQKLVFVRNGISNDTLAPIIEGVLQSPGMEHIESYSIDDPNDLFDLCRQTLQGSSDCFAAVIFTSSNDTNVEYIIALDGSVSNSYGYGDWKTGESVLTQRIFPLQWAISSQIGNFSTLPKPSTQGFAGDFGPKAYQFQGSNKPEAATNGPPWLSLVADIIAPIFVLIPIGVVYHLNIFVATERETSMAELMTAQHVTAVPRILSVLLSFYALYFPGFLVCSIIFTQVLFVKTSDILFLFITLLAGASFIAASHFIASFFGKAQLAGLYSSTLFFALSIVTLAASLSIEDHFGERLGLSLIFPPAAWANFIGDVAYREYNLKAFSLAPEPWIPSPDPQLLPPTQFQYLNGYLYIVFFVVQIIAYSLGTYVIERKLWGVTRKFDLIDSTSDVALRCTSLSKTYYGKRRWYWPFSRKGGPVLAIDSLDLEVKKGSVTFLLGPNGGGKTTTLKCVAGMTSMDAGSRLELNEAGLVFGICPQSNVFWENLTVQQHIKIWRKLKTASLDNTTVDDDDVLVECDLLDKLKAPAKTLSGGQMRKLQLAISFVGGSNVCCIDEASSGLDPLSRRNIWNIIQKGHTRRTILVTTHFLDEADVLADHIAIVYKGKLVCEGPSTSLKARFGDNYIIRSESDVEADTMVWRTTNSAEATRKLLELETLTEDNTYNVVFPTLEQVFLKVTSESHTAIHDHGGDGIVGEEENATVIDEKIFALETEAARDIDLEVGHSTGLVRQVATLFRKRYLLLQQKSGWIAYGINTIIPIIVAAALVKFFYRFTPLQTCAVNDQILRNATIGKSSQAAGYPVIAPLEQWDRPAIYEGYDGSPAIFLGPQSDFTGPAEDALYSTDISPYFQTFYGSTSNESTSELSLTSRVFVNSTADMISSITNASDSGFAGVGIFAPAPDSAIIYYYSYEDEYDSGKSMLAMNLITDRIVASTPGTSEGKMATATIRTMRTPSDVINFTSMPIAILLSLAFIAAASIAIIYPAFEKNNRVRALQYCNGVSPFALWFGYILFDMQFILIQSLIVWGLLFVGRPGDFWYAPNYILGVFILFGIATYLGVYLLSLITKKAAFAIAAGIHVLLFVLYIVSYVMNQSFGNVGNLYLTYSYIQYGLGLSSPGANLARALFVASNSFGVLCGKYGTADISTPFSYGRYGGVYANLLIQILVLIGVLSLYEYGSADWIRRNITHRGMPARLHYIVDSGDAPTQPPVLSEVEKTVTARAAAPPTEILTVSRLSKYFGKLFAVENISFDISANQTLALLGGNGAGKTTVINMIRGELKPNFGDIYLDGISVLKQPHKARLQMGVCPQDDAIDNLTVRQTLNFYATVKGLKNVELNVDKVLNALNITIYEHVSVKDLSGGTRRKLSVAIALLGNPRILLLDEPSTGQDAGAKRILWKALQDISANRAILLTTHSMEEAEALATNVAIMGTKMLATGTLSSLQETYGGAYNIRAVRLPESGLSAEEVEELVKEKFDGRVSNYFDSHGQISFHLPHEKKWLGSIMKIMEGLKGDVIEDEDEDDGTGGGAVGGSSAAQERTNVRILQDYTITGPTLEEVFMNVARESGTAGAGAAAGGV